MVSVHPATPALLAFVQMAGAGVSCAAVEDDSGALLAALSTSDLR